MLNVVGIVPREIPDISQAGGEIKFTLAWRDRIKSRRGGLDDQGAQGMARTSLAGPE